MAKRLSDTDAVSGTPVDGNSERHITIRPIANGYSVRESRYDGNGGYSSAEHFSKSEPCVTAPGNSSEMLMKRNEASGYLKQSRYKNRGG